MKLINEVLAVIDGGDWGWEKYPQVMAEALYSACHRHVPGPNLLAIAGNLDPTNRALVTRLMSITQEPDFANSDQLEAASYLEAKYGLGSDDYVYV